MEQSKDTPKPQGTPYALHEMFAMEWNPYNEGIGDVPHVYWQIRPRVWTDELLYSKEYILEEEKRNAPPKKYRLTEIK